MTKNYFFLLGIPWDLLAPLTAGSCNSSSVPSVRVVLKLGAVQRGSVNFRRCSMSNIAKWADGRTTSTLRGTGSDLSLFWGPSTGSAHSAGRWYRSSLSNRSRHRPQRRVQVYRSWGSPELVIGPVKKFIDKRSDLLKLSPRGIEIPPSFLFLKIFHEFGCKERDFLKISVQW